MRVSGSSLSIRRQVFALRHIERDYFTPERGYPADLSENGIPLRDMVWMDLEFASASDSQPR